MSSSTVLLVCTVLSFSVETFQNLNGVNEDITLGQNDEHSFHDFLTKNNDFTAAIFNQIAEYQPGNLIFSPISVKTILALVAEGAYGQTRLELIHALRLDDNNIQNEKSFYQLSRKIHNKANSNEMFMVNNIYIDSKFKLEDKFREQAVLIYDSNIEQVNFEDQRKTVNIIENWVEQQTNGKIKNLITESDIREETNLLLINAIYFNGLWKTPFAPSGTGVFYNWGGRHSTIVPSMYLEASFNYYEDHELGAKFLEVPYAGDNTSMVIILPNVRKGFRSILRYSEQLFKPQPWFQTKVEVRLPKFSIDSKISFVPILKKLGIERLFSDANELTGISEHTLNVADVIQKAFINVTETGTEAAAATAVIQGRFLVDSEKFVVDRPFFYYIQKEGIIMFAGKITAL